MNSKSKLYKDRLEHIINTSFNILEEKIKHGGIISNNESSFQLEIGYILKTIGNIYEFNRKEKFHLEFEKSIELSKKFEKSNTKKARIDIYLEIGDETTKVSAAIELKFLKKKNHREPNNRYDTFADISNLENYRNNEIDLCYFYIFTDHKHYVYQEKYSDSTTDFDIRHGKKYIANTKLVYNTEKSYKKGEITLLNNYDFIWNELDDNLYFLRLKIGE